ncbi:MAG: type II secretion system protein GspG [Candidatus Lindowbacteria bacterium]|nr:type II secretion system protein GspG [Candidatus Lindowbacteria bacterium]
MFSLVFTLPANATEWTDPDITKHVSHNNKFRFVVTPRKQIAKDEIDEDTSADKFHCWGELFAQDTAGNLTSIWRKKLINPIAPVRVSVENQGRFVATIDDWYHAGFGPRAVVLYDDRGVLVKRWPLEEILNQEEINLYTSQTITSLLWLNATPFFNVEKDELVLPTKVDFRFIDLQTLVIGNSLQTDRFREMNRSDGLKRLLVITIEASEIADKPSASQDGLGPLVLEAYQLAAHLAGTDPTEIGKYPFVRKMRELTFEAAEKFDTPLYEQLVIAHRAAKIAGTRAQMMSLRQALEMFYVNTMRYPSQEQGLAILAENEQGLEYISEEMLLDQWKNPIIYRSNPDDYNQPYNLISWGPDGKPATEDDITSEW